MTEKQKTSVDEIIGIIKTEEKTNSVELKKEYYREQSKDKHYTYLDYSRDGYIGSFYLNDKPITNKEVWNLLNEQDTEIKRLKKENQGIQDKVMRLLDYVEIKQCVTRTEIKKWWNGDDGDE